MKYRKVSDFKSIDSYKKYVLDMCKSHIEWPFFFTANGKHLTLEWQKKFSYYRSNGIIQDIHCDFYYEDKTSDIKIVIECDDISHKNKTIEDQIRDTMLIEQKGINKVFRFKARDIIWNCSSCIGEVKDYIKNKKIKLRKNAYDRKHKLENVKLSVEINENYTASKNVRNSHLEVSR